MSHINTSRVILRMWPRHVTRVKHVCVTYMRDMTVCHMTDTNHIAIHITSRYKSCCANYRGMSHEWSTFVSRICAIWLCMTWLICMTSRYKSCRNTNHVAHMTEACHTSELRLYHVYAQYDYVSHDWYKSYRDTNNVAIQIMLRIWPRHVTRVKHICVTYMRDMTMCHMTDTNHVAQWYKLYHAYDLCIWLSYCA